MIEPLNAFALGPLPALNLLSRGEVSSQAVLLSILPFSVVLAAVGPGKNAVALLLIVVVLALVAAAIMPREDTLPVHFVVGPGAAVLAPITPRVNALTFNIVIEEGTRVGGAVRPVKFALPVLLTIFVLALVAGVVGPDLFALAVLLVLKPEAFVSGAVRVVVHTVAVGLVILPLSIIDVAVGVDQSATAVGLVVFPVAFVETPVDPDLNSTAILLIVHVPFAFVISTVVQSLLLTLLASHAVICGRRVVIKLLQLLADGHDEVTRRSDLIVGLGELLLFPARSLHSWLKPVLGLDRTTRHNSLEVGLDSHSRLSLLLLGGFFGLWVAFIGGSIHRWIVYFRRFSRSRATISHSLFILLY